MLIIICHTVGQAVSPFPEFGIIHSKRNFSAKVRNVEIAGIDFLAIYTRNADFNNQSSGFNIQIAIFNIGFAVFNIQFANFNIQFTVFNIQIDEFNIEFAASLKNLPKNTIFRQIDQLATSGNGVFTW